MAISPEARPHLSDWIVMNHVQIVKHNEYIDVMEWPQYTLSKFDLDFSTSINKRRVEAMTITVPTQALLDLIYAEQKLNKLKRLPEVREAILYYTLNGYLKDD